jgi:hypothetical protein
VHFTGIPRFFVPVNTMQARETTMAHRALKRWAVSAGYGWRDARMSTARLRHRRIATKSAMPSRNATNGREILPDLLETCW